MIEENSEIILNIITDFLGNPKKSYENKGQYGFNCKECDDGRNKGNLEVNIYQGVWKCWSCSEINDTHGTIQKLVKRYGNKKQLKLINIFIPSEDNKITKKKIPKLKLPEHFKKFNEVSSIYPVRRQAYNYLTNRGITDEMIERYGIGFCDNGSHAGRIIIPSYDKKNELNYYIARSWDLHTKAKYKNPESEKDKIIFFESLIDWEKDITLVEGAFDSIFIPNSIPMLGKHMSSLLFDTLYEKAKGDITIALDGDAYDNAINLYHELNGGELYGRIKIVKLPLDKDIADLRGNINEYYITIR
jgi:DNA primase